MFDVKLKFSFIGLIVFILPMLINIVFFIHQGNHAEEKRLESYQWIEWIEQGSRVLYAIVLCSVTSNQKINFKSRYMVIGVLFLMLYYIVWIRYFMGGMEPGLLGKSFLGIPLPLAIFPVLYFLCASLWLHNYISFACMIVFGIAHYIVSYLSIRVQ